MAAKKTRAQLDREFAQALEIQRLKKRLDDGLDHVDYFDIEIEKLDDEIRGARTPTEFRRLDSIMTKLKADRAANYARSSRSSAPRFERDDRRTHIS